MNERFTQYWNRAKQYWNNFSKVQKWTLVGTVVFLLATIGTVVYNLSKTEYALAFTDLQPSDAAAITNYLKESGISYQLSADGTSIAVPKNNVAAIRLDVEAQGLNQSGSLGYGSLKDRPFGMTDEEFQVKKLSMIQGELQQMINLNEAVSSSKVMITLPETSVFLRDDRSEEASASVVLKLKPGYRLEQSQVDTMYHLVSKSVKNLPIENITISDQEGNLLPYSETGTASGSLADAAERQFLIKKQLEQDLQKSLLSILGKIFGPGKVVPMAYVTLDFDEKNSVENLVTPVVDNRGIEISVQEIEKNYTSESGATGGIVGTGTTQIPNYPAASDGGNASSEEVQRTVNYEVNHIRNEIRSSPYRITDLTLTVGIEPPDPDDPESLNAETREAIRQILVNLVRSALANSDRQFTDEELASRVSVLAHTFADTAAGEDAEPINWYLVGGIAAAALAAAALGGYALVRRRRNIEELVPEEQPVEYPSIDIDQVNENQVRRQLELLAKRRPEEFVKLLRTWLVDE